MEGISVFRNQLIREISFATLLFAPKPIPISHYRSLTDWLLVLLLRILRRRGAQQHQLLVVKPNDFIPSSLVIHWFSSPSCTTV